MMLQVHYPKEMSAPTHETIGQKVFDQLLGVAIQLGSISASHCAHFCLYNVQLHITICLITPGTNSNDHRKLTLG